MSFLAYLHRVCDHHPLSPAEAESAMEYILAGEATTAQIAGFLVAMRMRGETAEELIGFARAMRMKAQPVPVRPHPEPLLDTCGTGGDGLCTFNISTTVAFVAAGAGARVAKHGNRSLTSQCGSADILEALGVNIEIPPTAIGECIDQCGIGFLYAPAIHPAMKFAQPARKEIKIRTAFNLLGPLTNPTGASAQLAGAPSLQAAELMAYALANLGTKRALVVHGSDGLDEITTTGPTDAWFVEAGSVSRMQFSPESAGLPRTSLQALLGGGREENAAITQRVLSGEKGPCRDIVLLNAGAALWMAERATTLAGGMQLAELSIDSGCAAQALKSLCEVSQRAAAASRR